MHIHTCIHTLQHHLHHHHPHHRGGDYTDPLPYYYCYNYFNHFHHHHHRGGVGVLYRHRPITILLLLQQQPLPPPPTTHHHHPPPPHTAQGGEGTMEGGERGAWESWVIYTISTDSMTIKTTSTAWLHASFRKISKQPTNHLPHHPPSIFNPFAPDVSHRQGTCKAASNSASFFSSWARNEFTSCR